MHLLLFVCPCSGDSLWCTGIGAMPSPLPLLVVLDLDMCCWQPEMFELHGVSAHRNSQADACIILNSFFSRLETRYLYDVCYSNGACDVSYQAPSKWNPNDNSIKAGSDTIR
jgi:hypothetical protein